MTSEKTKKIKQFAPESLYQNIIQKIIKNKTKILLIFFFTIVLIRFVYPSCAAIKNNMEILNYVSQISEMKPDMDKFTGCIAEEKHRWTGTPVQTITLYFYDLNSDPDMLSEIYGLRNEFSDYADEKNALYVHAVFYLENKYEVDHYSSRHPDISLYIYSDRAEDVIMEIDCAENFIEQKNSRTNKMVEVLNADFSGVTYLYMSDFGEIDYSILNNFPDLRLFEVRDSFIGEDHAKKYLPENCEIDIQESRYK